MHLSISCVFWYVVLYTRVDMYQYFGRTCWFHLQAWSHSEDGVDWSLWNIDTCLPDMASHKNYNSNSCSCENLIWYFVNKIIKYVRFEVFTAVTKKSADFWDVTLCGCCKNRCFEGT
jgi:hypothetical protein